MNTWRVILATLVIFGAGLVTGGLLVKHSQRGTVRPTSMAALPPDSAPRPDGGVRGTNRMFNGPGMPGMRKDFLKNLDRELQLAPDQRERIEKILCQGQECTKQIWDQVAPQVRTEWKRVKEAIRAELTDEQKQKFEEFMNRPRKQEERRPQPPRDDQPPKAELSQPPPAETPPANP